MATDDENALEDAKQIAEFTALIALSAFFEGRPETLLLAILNYVGYCLRKGATDSKAMVMAAIAILHSLFGSFQEGKPYAEKALQEADGLKYPSQDGRAILIAYFFCLHAFRPYTDGLDPALKVLRSFLKYGVIEYIHIAIVNYTEFYFLSGLALPPFRKELSKFLEILKDYSQDHGLYELLPYAQFVDCLTGEAGNTLEISGKYMNQNQFLENHRVAKNKRYQNLVHLLQMILAVFYGEYSLAETASKKLVRRHEEMPCFGITRDFYMGLIAFANGKARRGRKFLRDVKGAASMGNPNASHMTQLLQAEEQARSRRAAAGVVRKAFDEAIRSAGRAGCMHHQALANERAAAYC